VPKNPRKFSKKERRSITESRDTFPLMNLNTVKSVESILNEEFPTPSHDKVGSPGQFEKEIMG
jgi:hypothetical protein